MLFCARPFVMGAMPTVMSPDADKLAYLRSTPVVHLFDDMVKHLLALQPVLQRVPQVLMQYLRSICRTAQKYVLQYGPYGWRIVRCMQFQASFPLGSGLGQSIVPDRWVVSHTWSCVHVSVAGRIAGAPFTNSQQQQ